VQLKQQQAIKATMLLEAMGKSKTRLLQKQVFLKLSPTPEFSHYYVKYIKLHSA